MQAWLIRTSFYLIATSVYLICADPRRDPSFEENVIRGLKAASDFHYHYERMKIVRIWNTVSNQLFPSSNCYDFKTVELDIYFISYKLEQLIGFLQGGQGSTWGEWPFPWGEVWTFDPNEDLPFDFVVEINVPQVAAANMVNRAGDLGPWIWILLCEPMDLASAEPTWFFMNVNNQSATAVGATTGKLIRHVPRKEICTGSHSPQPPADPGNRSGLYNASYPKLRGAGAMSFGELSTAS